MEGDANLDITRLRVSSPGSSSDARPRALGGLGLSSRGSSMPSASGSGFSGTTAESGRVAAGPPPAGGRQAVVGLGIGNGTFPASGTGRPVTPGAPSDPDTAVAAAGPGTAPSVGSDPRPDAVTNGTDLNENGHWLLASLGRLGLVTRRADGAVLGADGKPIQLARLAPRPGGTATDAVPDYGLSAQVSFADVQAFLTANGIEVSEIGGAFAEEFDTNNDRKFNQTEWARFERAISAYADCKAGNNHEGLVKIVNQYFSADGFRYLSQAEMEQTGSDFLSEVSGGIKFDGNGVIKIADLVKQLETFKTKDGYTPAWIDGLIADVKAAADNDGDAATLSKDELADLAQAYYLHGKYVMELIKDNGVHTRAIAGFMLKGEYKAQDKKKAERTEDTERAQGDKVKMPDENTKSEAEAAIAEAERLVAAGGDENLDKALEKYTEALRLALKFTVRAESEKRFVEGRIDEKLRTRIRGEKVIKERLRMLAEITDAQKAEFSGNVDRAKGDYATAYALLGRIRDGAKKIEKEARNSNGSMSDLSSRADSLFLLLERGDEKTPPYLKYMEVNTRLNFDTIISGASDGQRMVQAIQVEIMDIQEYRKDEKPDKPRDKGDKEYAERVIKSMQAIIARIKDTDFGEGIDKDELLKYAIYIQKSAEIILAMSKNDINGAQAIYNGGGEDIGFGAGRGIKDVAAEFGTNAESMKKMIDERKGKLEKGKKTQAAVEGQADSAAASLFE